MECELINLIQDLPDYWRKIVSYSIEKDASQEENSTNLQMITKEIVKEYSKKGYISSFTLKELLMLPNSTLILFYVYLYHQKKLKNERPKSIAEVNNNTTWLLKSDYCYFNIRALGETISETGNIINAVKVLPSLRVSGIHLAPFFECDYGIVYCQESYYRINPEIVNRFYEDKGVTPLEQMLFLIDCIHLLGKAAGFDVTPHTSRLSKLRLDRPELFRWVRLNQEKDGLYGGMLIDDQYEDGYQKKCSNHINRIVDKIKKQYGILYIDNIACNQEVVQKASASMNKALEEDGYYAVPPQTWNGICVPDFKKYDFINNMPVWNYRDLKGDDQGQHAIWLHTSLYLHKGMQANKLPAQTSANRSNGIVEKNEDVINFLKDYLEDAVSLYGFDFIRLDYTDHIFDNVRYIDGKEIAVNEMLTPGEILEIITKLRETKKGLGLQADHLGNDAKLFEKAGINIITGAEVGLPMNRLFLEETMGNLINGSNLQGSTCRSTFAIDTQDMAHPLFYGKELAHREGKVGTIGRLFLSRFANIGPYRRPKYEVIGNQDLSAGIYRSINKPESLHWGSNQEVYSSYHDIENLYDKLKGRLAVSYLEDYAVTSKHLYWSLFNEKENIRWLCIMPVILQEGIPCDSNRMKDMKDNEKEDVFYYSLEYPIENIKYRICTDVRKLSFKERGIPHSELIEITRTKEHQLQITMKEYGFLMLELEQINQ